MKDRSRPLVLAALVLLLVALSTIDISFIPLGGLGRQILPWIVVGIIVLFLTRVGCCGNSCGRDDVEDESPHSP
ncbi:MAG: hypothetical protein HKN37_10540 [Rhodothermales bacterium]|nr:hypothetical protein [Rhodothermales bacterium]